MKNEAASQLGKLSAQKRFLGMTPEEKSNYMKIVRAKRKIPVVKEEITIKTF